MQVAYHAKYLGMFLGPDKQDRAWQKPIKKFNERIRMWQDSPSGLFWSARLHNTFAMSTLLFVAQLEVPPESVVRQTVEALSKMAKGPFGNWFDAKDMWTMKEAFGQQASFQCLEWAAKAAKARIHVKNQGIISKELFKSDCRWLKQAIEESHIACRPFFSTWTQSCFLLNLENNKKWAQNFIGSIEEIRLTRADAREELHKDAKWLKQVQAAYYNCILAREIGNPRETVRRKHASWGLCNPQIHWEILGTYKQRTPDW